MAQRMSAEPARTSAGMVPSDAVDAVSSKVISEARKLDIVSSGVSFISRRRRDHPRIRPLCPYSLPRGERSKIRRDRCLVPCMNEARAHRDLE